MEAEFQPWAQLLIPAAIIFVYSLFQLYVMPIKKKGKTKEEIREAVVVTSIAMYFGVVSVTPVGFPYFIAFVKAGAHLWAWFFFGAIGIATLLVSYYKNRGLVPSEKHTPKTVDFFTRLFFIGVFGVYLKLSEVIWLGFIKNANAVLQGDDFLYRAGVVAALGGWVTAGTLLLAFMVVSWDEKKPVTGEKNTA